MIIKGEAIIERCSFPIVFTTDPNKSLHENANDWEAFARQTIIDNIDYLFRGVQMRFDNAASTGIIPNHSVLDEEDL